MNLQTIFGDLKSIGIKAGDILMKYYGGKLAITEKSQINLVTEADLATEDFIIDSLNQLTPDFKIQSEERSPTQGYPAKSEYCWVIDPLDGTTGFSHGYPMFAVSIALVDAARLPLMGIVYNPFYQELFSAIRGGGAFLNEKSIHINQNIELSKALVATGFPYYRRDEMDRLLMTIKAVLMNCHDIRRSGSAALDLCSVASGRCDIFYEEGLKPWDVAAGSLIVQEANGFTLNYSGESFDMDKPEIIAANKELIQAFRHIILKQVG